MIVIYLFINSSFLLISFPNNPKFPVGVLMDYIDHH
ncbi:hypothetical protein SAMN05216490_1906 [Mucilaginibacter mallensis]|uniref:Uncharacterized protein n=1 Tax=Mucilaginibacter mallensis TaxID=652787 RepID=A0A1H1VEV2_MUCMA|nr:hypothetical protein SAMN05216490_1906 [Mucilaginibacter mallensis]